jgi:hypothetical protein
MFRLIPLWSADLEVTGDFVHGILVDKLEDLGLNLSGIDLSEVALERLGAIAGLAPKIEVVDVLPQDIYMDRIIREEQRLMYGNTPARQISLGEVLYMFRTDDRDQITESIL